MRLNKCISVQTQKPNHLVKINTDHESANNQQTRRTQTTSIHYTTVKHHSRNDTVHNMSNIGSTQLFALNYS